MLGLKKQIIIFDTEYTTWEGAMERNWSEKNEHREIVGIGAILVEEKNNHFEEIDSFRVLTKPKINPVLSDYFTKLTKITQKEVNKEGFDFTVTLNKFHSWSTQKPIYSFGGDQDVLLENCKIHNIKFPFEISQFFDIKNVFEKFSVSTKGYMSSTIIKAFGKNNRRSAHNGLSDSRAIMDALNELYLHSTKKS